MTGKKNNPNDEWNKVPKVEDRSTIKPAFQSKDKGECIPLSDFWSHNQDLRKNTTPEAGPFQRCSMGDISESSDAEPMLGHAAVFALFTLKQMSWGGGFILFALLLLNFLFRLHSRKQAKKKAIKRFEESQVIPETSMRHVNNLGI